MEADILLPKRYTMYTFYFKLTKVEDNLLFKARMPACCKSKALT